MRFDAGGKEGRPATFVPGGNLVPMPLHRWYQGFERLTHHAWSTFDENGAAGGALAVCFHAIAGAKPAPAFAGIGLTQALAPRGPGQLRVTQVCRVLAACCRKQKCRKQCLRHSSSVSNGWQRLNTAGREQRACPGCARGRGRRCGFHRPGWQPPAPRKRPSCAGA